MIDHNKKMKNKVFLAWLVLTSFIAWQYMYGESYGFDFITFTIGWVFFGVILVLPFILIYKFLRTKTDS